MSFIQTGASSRVKGQHFRVTLFESQTMKVTKASVWAKGRGFHVFFHHFAILFKLFSVLRRFGYCEWQTLAFLATVVFESVCDESLTSISFKLWFICWSKS